MTGVNLQSIVGKLEQRMATLRGVSIVITALTTIEAAAVDRQIPLLPEETPANTDAKAHEQAMVLNRIRRRALLAGACAKIQHENGEPWRADQTTDWCIGYADYILRTLTEGELLRLSKVASDCCYGLADGSTEVARIGTEDTEGN